MEYTVEIGKHDFKPNNQSWFTASNKLSGYFMFDESMYFTSEDYDYPYGNDSYDWNKLCGLTWFLSGNANWSGMLAWRPNQKEKNVFELAGYVNPKSGGFEYSKLMDVKAGEKFFYKLTWVADRMVFKIIKDKENYFEMPLKNIPWWFSFYRQIGPYFGGNRPAHKNMKLELVM